MDSSKLAGLKITGFANRVKQGKNRVVLVPPAKFQMLPLLFALRVAGGQQAAEHRDADCLEEVPPQSVPSFLPADSLCDSRAHTGNEND